MHTIESGPAPKIDQQQPDELVNLRVAELMQFPIQAAERSVSPMKFEAAVRVAPQEPSRQLKVDGLH